MNEQAQTFKKEIEIERLRKAIEQGSFIFIVSLGYSILFVLVLWEYVSQSSLLFWFISLNYINLVKWIYFHKYSNYLNSDNVANLLNVKLVLFFGAFLSGLCWGIASLLFIDPLYPNTLLIMLVSVFFVSMSSILSLFSYLSAVMSFIIPAGGFLIVPLLMDEDKGIINLGLISAVTLVVSIVGCIKVGRSFNETLHLNFENAALRRDSEEKSLLLENALANIDQGITLSDKDDRLRMWNRQFARILGSKQNEIQPDVNLASILNAAEPPLTVDKKNKTEQYFKDGRVFEIQQNFIAEGGRVVTYTDISDRFKREHALEQARKTAEQVNAAKTRFLAAASHDLRQPMHALGLFFAELSNRVHSPETELLIDQVNDSINAINSMLNSLLDISKLDAGVIKPEIENFNLAALFSKLKMDFIPIAAECHNELRIHQTNLMVKSDIVMLERMLRNLINNALRYTNYGRVLVAARTRGKNVQILVLDNGVGIANNQLDEIFVEFHQVENPARDRRKGLGLGLAIVKRLAKLLDHEITVTSEYGRGSCFSIALPSAINMPVTSCEKEMTYASLHPLGGYQVLVIDDDEAVLEGMNGLLTRWGYHVTTALSSDQAFDKLKNNLTKPKLLIVDYRLADNLSGVEVAKHLQQSIAYPTSVLIITGDTGPELLQQTKQSSYPLLHKPVNPAKLRSTILYLFSKLNN